MNDNITKDDLSQFGILLVEQFKKIDRKISLVSGVSKANAVLSALKGGLVDVLILDSNLAEALLKLTQE